MASIIRTDALQNLNTSNIITQTNVTTITLGSSGQTIALASGASSSGFGATYNSGLNWTSTLVTSALTVSAGTGYFVNTSTAAITVTLPASPTFGSIVGIADYSGYASTNNITVNPNGNKLEGGTLNKIITTNKESVILNYVDSTRGWLPTSGVNNGSDALSPAPYSVDFLVIAGGASGGNSSGAGGGAGGYRSSNSTYGSSGGGNTSAESSLTFTGGTVYTITVGAGGAGKNESGQGFSGNDSSISGTGITTITSIGGGGGGNGPNAGLNGGSGGGAGTTAGSGTANQGFSGGASPNGGGGGAGEAGNTDGASDGGDGVASTITGSSVTRGGGGGDTGGNGGGGSAPGAGTANTGGGGGYWTGAGPGSGAGGSGVVILRMPTASYSGTTTGSPTVSTSGSDTILVYNASGSYTG